MFFVSQVKSFIETQRALLAEIQNGCKRNFILAKEKEETEQMMRQSASMAEIATEDGTGEEEEEEAPASEEKDDKDGKEGEIVEVIETTGKEEQASIPSGASSETNVESDSDTEDEEEEEVITKSCSTNTNQAAPQTQQGAEQPPPSASGTSSSPSDPPACVPSIIPGITITESPAPPGTPPSPGRCISVSSPGRGRKIFTVTRVITPPDQQQQQLLLQKAGLAPLSQTKELSKKPMTPPASQTPTETQQTQEDVKEHSPAPALSTDCNVTEQRSIAHSESTLNTPQTPTLETQSTSPPTEDVTASTLDPKVTDPNLLAPALPSDPPAEQAGAVQLTEEVIQSTQSPQPENTSVEGEEEKVEDGREPMSPDSTGEESKQSDEPSPTHDSVPAVDTQPPTPALEQLQDELASASKENQSPHQTEKEEEQQEASASLSEIDIPTSTEEEDNQPNQEEPSPKQQTEADEQSVESVPSVLTDQPAPAASQSETQETSLQAEESSESPESAPSGSASPVKVEDSGDESSADECFAEALDGEEVNSALPNGLKPEFSLHRLDAESPKPGSCVMEHGESL